MITDKIGNRIRELRSHTGLSQEKFAQKIGMDRTYFASVELGKRNISIVNIEKIANGIIYTKDHRYIKLIEVVPINFLKIFESSPI